MNMQQQDRTENNRDNQSITSGKDIGLALCHVCHLVISLKDSKGTDICCPRCNSPIHLRKPHSVTYTWALLLTSFILLFPANLLPIMQVEYMGLAERSTIMDGIIYFFKEGSYGIGMVILTASVLVPLFKIIGICLILLSLHFRWKTWLRHKTIMFRFIKFIGRWSMLDIFVIALLTALVDFGFFTTIQAAPAAPFFCMVVIFTMFAAECFDTRLLWD